MIPLFIHAVLGALASSGLAFDSAYTYAAVASPSGRRCLVRTEHLNFFLVDQRSGSVVGEIHDPDQGTKTLNRLAGEEVSAVAFSGNGKSVVVGTSSSVSTWSAKTGKLRRRLVLPKDIHGRIFALNQMCSRIFVAGSNQSLFWNLQNNTVTSIDTSAFNVVGAAWHHDKVFAISVSHFQPKLLVLAETGKVRESLPLAGAGQMLISPSGRFLALKLDGLIVLYDLFRLHESRRFTLHNVGVFWDGEVLTLPFEGGIKCYDTATGEMVGPKNEFKNGFNMYYFHGQHCFFDATSHRFLGYWPELTQ